MEPVADKVNALVCVDVVFFFSPSFFFLFTFWFDSRHGFDKEDILPLIWPVLPSFTEFYRVLPSLTELNVDRTVDSKVMASSIDSITLGELVVLKVLAAAAAAAATPVMAPSTPAVGWPSDAGGGSWRRRCWLRLAAASRWSCSMRPIRS